MNRTRTALLAGIVTVPLLGGFVVQERATADGARLFSQVLDLVSVRFVDTVTTAMLYEKAARGLVSQLQDPYSELLSPSQVRQFNSNTGGRYGGLGMSIEEQQGKGVTVAKVFHNTPAERAGIREGDVIVLVDTVSTRGWTSKQTADALTGTPGTKVTVGFARPGVASPIKIEFTRAVIRAPAVRYAMSFNRVGYVLLDQFNENATPELTESIRKLQTENVRGIVLDLRGNPGGFLDQALSISNLFLRQGQEIASVRGRNSEPQVYFAREKPIAPEIPLVILTNQYTASASEIVAGALQDHDRAVIVGNTSFGKGLVQTMFPNLEGGWALKLTTAKWYTPSGRSIQKDRKLTAEGQFVEVHPDSLETDSTRKARPRFKSDGGRVVYGGGAVTPDLIVQADTLTTAEQDFRKAMAPKSQEYYVALYDLGYELKSQVRPDFAVKPEWRAEFLSRLEKAGVKVDRKQWEAASTLIDRDLELRVARSAFGDSTVRRRTLDEDRQLQKAIEIIQKGGTQKDLFALVAARPQR